MPRAVVVGCPDDDAESLDAESLGLKTGNPVTPSQTRRRTCCSDRCLAVYSALVLTLLLLSSSGALLAGRGGLPPPTLMVEPTLRNSSVTRGALLDLEAASKAEKDASTMKPSTACDLAGDYTYQGGKQVVSMRQNEAMLVATSATDIWGAALGTYSAGAVLMDFGQEDPFKGVVTCENGAATITWSNGAIWNQQATAPDACGNIKPWNGASPLGWDASHRCGWQQHKGTDVKMCIRDYKDMVSDKLREEGHWPDCDALLSLWERLPDRSLFMPAKKSSTACSQHYPVKKVFVDIGANIGACTFPIAAKSSVPTVVSFEPNPTNLFYLTSTIVENKLQDKVHVYPMALGEDHGQVKIYSNQNPGSSVLGKPAVGDEKLVTTVKVVLLQDIFTAASQPYIHLMKMDAQGYEVNILRGAFSLFASGAVNAIKFEYAPLLLENAKSSGAEMLNLLLVLGFEILQPDSFQPVSQERLFELACVASNAWAMWDFVAVFVGHKKASAQRQVGCDKPRAASSSAGQSPAQKPDLPRPALPEQHGTTQKPELLRPALPGQPRGAKTGR